MGGCPYGLPALPRRRGVLRVQKLGESDRIITLLTRRHGRIRAAAKGVRRTTSKFGARLEPFGHVDVQIAGTSASRTGRCTRCGQVEGIELYGKQLGRRLPALHGGERHRRDRRAAHPGRARAVAAAVPAHPRRAAGPGRRPSTRSTLVLDAYLLRAMATAGWAPALAACAVCGTPGPHAAFSVTAGGAVCPDCRPPGAPSRPRPPSSSWSRSTAGRLGASPTPAEPAPRRECSGLVAAHLQWHLERGLRSLPLVDRIRRTEICVIERPTTLRRRDVSRPPSRPHPSGARPPALPAGGAAQARRDRHGRQRPLGQGARPAPHQGPRAGRVLACSTPSRARSSSASRTCRRTRSPPRTGGARRRRCAS